MKKALVTGGLGFIGSHLVEMLLEKGITSVIIDNKMTNVVDEDYFENKGCKVIAKSILETDLDDVGEVDVVFHLASIVGPSGILKHAGDIGKSLINDTVKLRKLCIEKGIKLVDISTSEIYGHTGVLKEDSEKVFPKKYQIRTEYGAGKMVAEMALVNKAKLEKRLKYHIIRPFNVTGPRQKPDGGFVLPRFVIAALTEQPLTVFGDGKQKRAFTHVRDICKGILEITDSEIENEEWNLGNPNNEMTINEMADRVIMIIKKKYPEKDPKKIYVDPKKIHGPLFAEAVEKLPYVEKAKKRIGWEPEIASDKIIEEIIDFYADKVGKKDYFFKVI